MPPSVATLNSSNHLESDKVMQGHFQTVTGGTATAFFNYEFPIGHTVLIHAKIFGAATSSDGYGSNANIFGAFRREDDVGGTVVSTTTQQYTSSYFLGTSSASITPVANQGFAVSYTVGDQDPNVLLSHGNDFYQFAISIEITIIKNLT